MFQDNLFSHTRMVQRTLQNGTVLRLKLAPLPGARARVLEYYRRRAGEHWQRVKEEEGWELAYRQLKLKESFTDLFK